MERITFLQPGVFRALVLTALWCALTSLTPPAYAKETEDQSAPAAENFCGTQEIWIKKQAADPKYASPDACPAYGDCDYPNVRDVWIPGVSQPVTHIRLVIHILRNDDGSNPISSDALAQTQINRLNQDYLPVGIQFEATINHVNSTAWRVLSESEINAMKSATAISPDSALNMWVTQVDFGYSFGTFPWDSEAKRSTGGIVMGHFHWTGGANSVVAHEVGHCLGLWHTFNGVSEVSECGACYEYRGASDADLLGDRCEDTPPGPLSYSCSNSSGTDPCTSLPWGYTMPENYMGYASQSCYDLFTPQQKGRIHCWINDRLSSWTVGVNFTVDSTFGPAPMTVLFDASANKAVSAWTWEFGDGQQAAVEDPAHEYTEPGYYSVGVTIQTPDGPYVEYKPGLVSVYGDTLRMDSALYTPGQPIRIDIVAENFLPLKEMHIPVTWAGPMNLQFDSMSTAGLRTDYFEYVQVINYDPYNKRVAINLNASNAGTQPLLPPGTEPVLSLFFSGTGQATGDNPIAMTSYASHSPRFVAAGGQYVPTLYNGLIMVNSGCCVGNVGNIDCDPADLITMGDLTVLIDHLFISLEPVCCLEEAELDAVPPVSMSDLTVLIDHLFVSFLPTSACP